MATTYTATYHGGWEGETAGSDGLDCTLTGNALPDGAVISSISYSIEMSADAFLSSKHWCVHSFYLGDGSPYASYNEVSMTNDAVTGTMTFASGDEYVFDGSVNLHAKVNTDHSVRSYMWGVTITIRYTIPSTSSTVSLSKSIIEAGESIDVTVNNDRISSVSHSVVFSCGTYSETMTIAAGATTCSYTIPLSWCNAISSSTSGTVSVKVSTISGGSVIGTVTKTFTLSVPESIVPSIGSLSASIVNGNDGGYVQNRSGCVLTGNDAIGSYGSRIVLYTFIGVSESGQTVFSNAIETNATSIPTITTSGTIIFSLYATDSRGRKSNIVTTSISVMKYNPPTISELLAFRCDSEGVSSENGTYISASCKVSYYELEGANNCTISISYQKHGDSDWTQAYMMSYADFAQNGIYVMGEGAISTEYSYSVKVSVSDAFVTIERAVNVSTAVYTMFFKEGGTGVAFGKVCENTFAVEFTPDWKLLYGAFNLRPVCYTEDSTPPANPVEGLIWLEKVREWQQE